MKNIKNGLLSCVRTGLFSLIVLAPSFLAAKEVTLTEKDNGKRVSLDIQDTLRVNLKGNRTTGFDWTVVSQPVEGIKLIDSRYCPIAPVKCGSPGVSVFKFSAVSPCSSELKFHYTKKWEKDVPPAKEFNVFITVEGKKE